MNSIGLHNVATAIGWEKVNDDADFSTYQYKRQISPKEAIVNVVRIYNEVSTDEFLETLFIIKNVLPRKLLGRINKITKSLNPESISGALDAVCFSLDEYKQKCEYTKLVEYAALVDVDLKELGYGFQFELAKKTRKQILTLIESKLPMEQATALAKIKKTEYKIAHLKAIRNAVKDAE